VTIEPGLLDLLADQLAKPDTTWSIGTFGAIAEFDRDADELSTFRRTEETIAVITRRGGLRLKPSAAVRPIASESLTTQSWNQRVALCLPETSCAMSGRVVLTEIGPDHDSLLAENRDDSLFDLGLGTLQLDACVRVGDPEIATHLRRWTGQSLFAPENGAMGVILAANPHRVFLSQLGRVEVFQPIPKPDGTSPQGPHTHVLPRLLRHKRTHGATEALPPGWIPCAHFYPPHPMRNAPGRESSIQAKRHKAFQELLSRYGDPELLDIKRRVIEAINASTPPSGVKACSLHREDQ
jgi:hypothetical protein